MSRAAPDTRGRGAAREVRCRLGQLFPGRVASVWGRAVRECPGAGKTVLWTLLGGVPLPQATAGTAAPWPQPEPVVSDRRGALTHCIEQVSASRPQAQPRSSATVCAWARRPEPCADLLLPGSPRSHDKGLGAARSHRSQTSSQSTEFSGEPSGWGVGIQSPPPQGGGGGRRERRRGLRPPQSSVFTCC